MLDTINNFDSSAFYNTTVEAVKNFRSSELYNTTMEGAATVGAVAWQAGRRSACAVATNSCVVHALFIGIVSVGLLGAAAGVTQGKGAPLSLKERVGAGCVAGLGIGIMVGQLYMAASLAGCAFN